MFSINTKPVYKVFLIVFMSGFFLTGCEKKEVDGFLNTFFKDHVAQREIGRCESEPGTLVEPYHPWLLTRIADAIFVTPKQEGSPIENCIPDIDPHVVANLTAEERAKNRADFVNTLYKYLVVKRFKKESGQTITIRQTFLELQELARRGEELAHIELNLTDYYSNETKQYRFKEDNRHYQRLKALSDSGYGIFLKTHCEATTARLVMPISKASMWPSRCAGRRAAAGCPPTRPPMPCR